MTSKTPSKGYVEAWEVESYTGIDTYTVSKRADGTYACSCAAWKFARAPKPDCKHIDVVRSGLAVGAKDGSYTCNLCGYNTLKVADMRAHRSTAFGNGCAYRAPAVPSLQNRAYIDAAATVDKIVTRPKAEPDGMERFTVRRKFKFN
jgi:hypothetical protein